MSTAILYESNLDLECVKARFLLRALDLDYDTVAVDGYPGRDETSRLFLQRHGALPVLQLDGETSCGARAVLRHIADKLDAEGRFGDDASPWSDFAATELNAVAEARSAALFGAGASAEQVAKARAVLLILEDALCLRVIGAQLWFGEDGPSLADIAIYPAVALMRDFGLEFEEFPTLRSWVFRMRALAPALSTPGISDIV